MADEQVISQLKERVAFLEGLVMSLVAKNESTANPAAAQANTNPATNAQTGPATAAEAPPGEVPFLMKLPPELRTNILERVFQPAFAAAPYGLITPPLLPVTMYTSLTRLPAVLQVNQAMRAESVALFHGLARSKIAELEIENKQIYPEYETLKKEHEAANDFSWPSTAGLAELRDKVTDNFVAMREVDSVCKALEGTYECKVILPPRWQRSEW
jgi:hypothetical protein